MVADRNRYKFIVDRGTDFDVAAIVAVFLAIPHFKGKLARKGGAVHA